VSAECSLDDGAKADFSCEFGCSTGYGCIFEQGEQAVKADPPLKGGYMVKVDWKLDVPEGLSTSVAVFGNDASRRLLFATSASRLYSVSGQGEVKWAIDLPDKVVNSLSVNPLDGTAYAGCDDGFLYAYDQDGALAWKYESSGPIRSTVLVIADGEQAEVVFSTLDGTVKTLSGDGGLLSSLKMLDCTDCDHANIFFSASVQVLHVVLIDEQQPGTMGSLYYGALDKQTDSLYLSEHLPKVLDFDYYFGHVTVLTGETIERFGFHRQDGTLLGYDYVLDLTAPFNVEEADGNGPIQLEDCTTVGSLGGSSVPLICAGTLYVIDDIYSVDGRKVSLVYDGKDTFVAGRHEMQQAEKDVWVLAKKRAHYFFAKDYGTLTGLAFSLNLTVTDDCLTQLTSCTVNSPEGGRHYFPAADGVYAISVDYRW